MIAYAGLTQAVRNQLRLPVESGVSPSCLLSNGVGLAA